jgi:putative endonuclease
MSATERGRHAEQHAADYLAAAGYRILARNWRNRWCELDIVARDSHGAVHFVEVKYRATTRYGSAAEYISRDKTARLIRAATAWSQAQNYDGPYQIGVATVEGDLDHPTVAYLPNAIFA